jgi:uncharacterized membrane protein YoaK (UPF0700 family)
MDLVTIWRIANFALAFSAFVWLMLDLRHMYLKLSHRRLYLTFSLAGLLLAVVIGSMWNLYQKNPPFIQTGIVTASCAWCLIGLWVSRNEDE